ncbi:MAG: hypothetical protein LDL07_08755 [Desulfarculus sp.]|nr:hypothetical protein [Desulfarculus sp.]
MHLDAILPACPPHLEDEAWLIETSGEMPEVALHESLHHLGEVSPAELDCLRGAVIRAYLRLLGRDLDHANLGQPHFRGLERAWQNWLRLGGFLDRLGWNWPLGLADQVRQALARHLDAEAAALAAGRNHATANPEAVTGLAQALGLDLTPWREALENLARLPLPDFRGLAALARLERAPARAKRRQEREGKLWIETLDQAGRVVSSASLPLLGPSGGEAPELRAQAEMVWGLVPLPRA